MPTQRQLDCLTFIDAAMIKSGGVRPTYDEIAKALVMPIVRAALEKADAAP